MTCGLRRVNPDRMMVRPGPQEVGHTYVRKEFHPFLVPLGAVQACLNTSHPLSHIGLSKTRPIETQINQSTLINQMLELTHTRLSPRFS